MNDLQKIIKYLAMALAALLAVGIIGGALSLFGLFGGFFGGDAVAKDVQTYALSSDIRRLDIEINAADFTIEQGDNFLVESNLKDLTVEEKGGALTIREKRRSGLNYTGASLTLHIPADTVFEKVNIKTGAGRMTAERLAADTMELELGAGEVTIDTLTATKSATIEGGVGEVRIAGGQLHDLEMTMGLGELDISSALSGDCSFELGMGETSITVLGDREAYQLDIEKGIGSITVDGAGVTEYKERAETENSLEIRGGIGAVELRFETPSAD